MKITKHTPEEIDTHARLAAIAMERVADSFDELVNHPTPKRKTAAAMRAWALRGIEPEQEAGAIIFGAIARGIITNKAIVEAADVPGDGNVGPRDCYEIFHRVAKLFHESSPDLLALTSVEHVEGKAFDELKSRRAIRGKSLLCKIWAELFRVGFVVRIGGPPRVSADSGGKTQTQLAAMLGVVESTIRNWSKRSNVPARVSHGEEYTRGEIERIIEWGAEHGAERTSRESRRIVEGKAAR